jgi:hypothetical protein
MSSNSLSTIERLLLSSVSNQSNRWEDRGVCRRHRHLSMTHGQHPSLWESASTPDVKRICNVMSRRLRYGGTSMVGTPVDAAEDAGFVPLCQVRLINRRLSCRVIFTVLGQPAARQGHFLRDRHTTSTHPYSTIPLHRTTTRWNIWVDHDVYP